MPDVPKVPGVPSLSAYAPNTAALVVADAFVAIRAFLPPAWGVYINGLPVITPASQVTQAFGSALSAISSIASLIGFPNVVPVVASTIEFDYGADSPISNYPQQEGAFQSYDKVQLPFDVKLKLATSGAGNRQAFFSTLEALRTSTALVDIVTPEGVFRSCNCKHVSYTRRAGNGVDLVVADVWFEEVRVVAQADFSSTQTPAVAGPQALGNVQPQTPSTAVQQQFAVASSSGAP